MLRVYYFMLNMSRNSILYKEIYTYIYTNIHICVYTLGSLDKVLCKAANPAKIKVTTSLKTTEAEFQNERREGGLFNGMASLFSQKEPKGPTHARKPPSDLRESFPAARTEGNFCLRFSLVRL